MDASNLIPRSESRIQDTDLVAVAWASRGCLLHNGVDLVSVCEDRPWRLLSGLCAGVREDGASSAWGIRFASLP